MPGYSQLKKLSETVLKLGNEINLRAERGEKAIPVIVPDTIEDIDDSQDFVLGMPEKPKPPEPEPEESVEEAEGVESENDSSNVSVDDLLSGIAAGGDLDLSAFGEEPSNSKSKSKSKEKAAKAKPEPESEPEPPPKPKGISGSGYSGFGFDDDGNLESGGDELKPDIEALMGGPGKSAQSLSGVSQSSGATGIPELDAILNPKKEEPSEPETPSTPEPESLPPQEIDFDGIDDLQIEEYAPPSSTQDSGNVDASALFGDDVEDFELPSQPPAPKKSDFKPLPIEDDLYVLKPDIFTDGSSATKENPPYYATLPYGQLPKQPEGKENAEKKELAEDLPVSDIPDMDELLEPESAPKEDAVSDIPDMDSLLEPEAAPKEDAVSDIPDMDGLLEPEAAPKEDAVSDIPDMDSLLEPESAQEIQDVSEAESPAEEILDPFSESKKEFEGGPSIDLNMDLPEEISEVPPEVSALDNGGFDLPDTEESPAAESPSGEEPSAFDLPDMDGLDFDLPAEDNLAAESPALDGAAEESGVEESGGEENAFGDGGSLDELNLGGEGGQEISADAVEAPKSDEDIFSSDGMDFSSFDMPDSFSDGQEESQEGALPGESLSGTDDATSSALDGFDIQDTDSQLSKASDDFALEGGGDDFSIPGFSEEDADPYANAGKNVDQVDFSGAVTGDGSQRTSLTEEEYQKFKKNLREYPLNVRIAVEDMIAKNEFTDEVVFELIDKILKKVTARQLAGHLEKVLDISLPVPRDYERRTAAEYEAYKASFAYQLKSRILPAVIIGIFAAMILFCLGYLGHRYIYKPFAAEKLYKEGYALIQRDEFPQSQMKFDEALKYKSKKKWFYRYARGYRAKKQYDRAELFYKNILKRFNHDKQAGLEYAQMEVEDLANYELAEEILKRELLDNHVNDPDGILALGDTYLEWATEKDPAKFDDAYQTYSRLQQLYGGKNPNLYQSRFLRYNIRTDQLRNVLELKEYFYAQGEKSLSADDWTELSGYLMDKQRGDLTAQQRFLRDKIENVRDMILFAVKGAPDNPVANYNLSRYLVQVGDHAKAVQSLKRTEQLFDQAENLRRRSIYKQLNNYRLLGEEYLYDREYILARETFNKGLTLFERKNRDSNFDSDKNVGVMYSDMGDLDYFISGDLDAARMSYQSSIDNKNDTPSIRYRVGYIDYSGQNYQSALNNFIKANQQLTEDTHLMLALGNTLSLKNDNYAAQGYYDRLLERLDLIREKYGIVSPQTDERAGDMVETYVKASNNLGVSLFRIARQSGSSSKNAASLVNFQNSIRYYDAMTRNQETMIRLPGSNLAEMNLRYATNPFPKFEPEIYTGIPRVLDGEKGLEQ